MAQIEGFKFLAQHELGSYGNIGEGMSMQLTADGRRILWLAHESAPINFTALDVTDPRQPKMVVQTRLPHERMRSNSLETVGDMMAVAYQCTKHGDQPAGIELFDISVPEQPRSISFIDCSGPHSRGCHQLWFVDGKTIHASAGSADFVPRNIKDDQFYRAFDISDPLKPRLLGEWWMPGTRDTDEAPPLPRLQGFDYGCRAHNTNVYPERPDRAYVGYINAGFVVLDISDISRPREITRWNHHPPYKGFTHTVLPLFSRDLFIVSDESVSPTNADWPKLCWVFNVADEARPVPISTLPIPPQEKIADKVVRYGAHNLHENKPGPSFRSETLVFGTYFAGGLRVHDVTDPYRPEEVAWFIPDNPNSPAGVTQINDVYVDDRGVVFTVDRVAGGLYALEMAL